MVAVANIHYSIALTDHDAFAPIDFIQDIIHFCKSASAFVLKVLRLLFSLGSQSFSLVAQFVVVGSPLSEEDFVRTPWNGCTSPRQRMG